MKDSLIIIDPHWSGVVYFRRENKFSTDEKRAIGITFQNEDRGGIAQWQSIRLQIEMSSVQLRVPPKHELCGIDWLCDISCVYTVDTIG